MSRSTAKNIAGFIHSKDFLGRLVVEPDFDITAIIRPPFYVPEGKKVNDLLKEMQRKRIHMALVVDEYGGINGLVTTEDLLEELVGEIHGRQGPERLGNESQSQVRLGARVHAGGLRWDIAGIAGLKRFDPNAGLVVGITYEFQAFARKRSPRTIK